MNTDAPPPAVHLSQGQGSTRDCPHWCGALRVFSSLTVAQSVVLAAPASLRGPLPRLASVAGPQALPPAGKRGHSRRPAWFYVQFIHSSIQYTETFIYRYIYRISYINLSLLFTAILVWIFHTGSTKSHGRMARTVPECLWGPAARYRLHMEVAQAPGRTGQLTAGSLCCGLGDRVGVGLSLAGLRGVAQTPPSVVWGGRERCSAGPFLQGCGGEGAGRGGLTLGHPGLSPSLPQPQVCNPVWLQPWGWGVCP